MSENHRTQISDHLHAKETEDLLEIWQNGDTDEWDEKVFEIIQEILLERIGSVPPQSGLRQVAQFLNRADGFLQSGELEKALQECETALQILPDHPQTYNARGLIFDGMGQTERAISDYRKAIQLTPEFKDAWENMLSAEQELEEKYQESAAKQHLDLAHACACDDEAEQALEECELAKATLPEIAAAYHDLGMVLHELRQYEPAIEAYLTALRLNCKFHAARENLRNARVRLEEEKYRQLGLENQSDEPIEEDITLEFEESEIEEESGDENLLPQWLYLDEQAFLLAGWAGHRTRQRRSGYDPLDTDFESSRMQGVIIRKAITGKFRTKNPIYLLLITCMGLIFSAPMLSAIGLLYGEWSAFGYLVFLFPYWFVGVALLVNVFLSFESKKPEAADENGYAFY